MTVRAKNADWLGLTPEEPLEPDLPICDPHHHLWDKRPREVAERYLLDEILEDIATGHNIVSTVFVECDAMYKADGSERLRPVGETEFVGGIAAMAGSGLYGPARVAAGIVGAADLRLGDAVAEVLDAHLAAGGGRFRGIRQMAAWDRDPALPVPRGDPGAGLLQRPEFRAGFRHLAPRQLTFEAWVYHPQLPDVTALARAFPDTTIILEHFGGPVGIGSYAGRQQEVYAEWRALVAELARCPNVVAKLGCMTLLDLSGFGWRERPRPPTSDELAQALRPYCESVIEQFGDDRCMFESNFPVDKASCSYQVVWNAFKRLTAGASAATKAALFHDTAVRVYRLPPGA